MIALADVQVAEILTDVITQVQSQPLRVATAVVHTRWSAL